MSSDYKRAFLQNRGKERCSECGLFMCICQTSLSEFGFEQTAVLKEVSHDRKILGCPGKCLNQDKCLECYDFDKYSERVRV